MTPSRTADGPPRLEVNERQQVHCPRMVLQGSQLELYWTPREAGPLSDPLMNPLLVFSFFCRPTQDNTSTNLASIRGAPQPGYKFKPLTGPPVCRDPLRLPEPNVIHARFDIDHLRSCCTITVFSIQPSPAAWPKTREHDAPTFGNVCSSCDCDEITVEIKYDISRPRVGAEKDNKLLKRNNSR